MIQIERFVEVPNTGVREPVHASQFADELCYQIAQDYGYAEVVWYAPVSYTHLTLPTIYSV